MNLKQTYFMDALTLTTLTLLFSVISLIMLAYANRFLAYAAVIHSLHDKYLQKKDSILIAQIENIKKATLLNTVDANFWNKQFITLCTYYVFNLHRTKHHCYLGIWFSFNFSNNIISLALFNC